MQVQGTASQEDAQKIWEQLDAEESGRAPAADAEPPANDAPASASTDPAPAANHNADPADATKGGDAAAPTGDQVLLDKIAGLETMLSQVTQRLRNAEGHIGGLGSQLKQQLQTAQQVSAKGGDAPTATEIRDAQRNPEAMARLKSDYPEFAEAMESALNERLSSLEQRLAQQQQPTEYGRLSSWDGCSVSRGKFRCLRRATARKTLCACWTCTPKPRAQPRLKGRSA